MLTSLCRLGRQSSRLPPSIRPLSRQFSQKGDQPDQNDKEEKNEKIMFERFQKPEKNEKSEKPEAGQKEANSSQGTVLFNRKQPQHQSQQKTTGGDSEKSAPTSTPPSNKFLKKKTNSLFNKDTGSDGNSTAASGVEKVKEIEVKKELFNKGAQQVEKEKEKGTPASNLKYSQFLKVPTPPPVDKGEDSEVSGKQKVDAEDTRGYRTRGFDFTQANKE